MKAVGVQRGYDIAGPMSYGEKLGDFADLHNPEVVQRDEATR